MPRGNLAILRARLSEQLVGGNLKRNTRLTIDDGCSFIHNGRQSAFHYASDAGELEQEETKHVSTDSPHFTSQ